jgi:hypothetical protein
LHDGAPADLARVASEQLALLRELLTPLMTGIGRVNDGQEQRLAEIASAIAGMQRTIERGMSRPERVDVSLVTHSRTNFFRPVSSGDVGLGVSVRPDMQRIRRSRIHPRRIERRFSGRLRRPL